MNSFARLFAVACFACLPAVWLSAGVDEVITQARGAIGPEEKLNAVTSIHYTGRLETTAPDAEGALKPVDVSIELIFKKHDRQRIVATSDKKIEVTALYGYEAWQREQDPADGSRWRLTLLPPAHMQRLRANTWEVLSFYRGIERRGGRIDDLGTVTFEGKPCSRLSFVHDDGTIFTRTFDQSSGRLLLTEAGNGIEIREEGEIFAGGLRFPRKMVTVNRAAPGEKPRVISITFDKVTVNEEFADSLFEIPLFNR